MPYRSDKETRAITKIILEAGAKARKETETTPEPDLTKPMDWPVTCTVGPGLEGAIACETKVGYVNGAKGWLIYRGYDIFELCAYSTFEEVSYLLLNGNLPTHSQLEDYKNQLLKYRNMNKMMSILMGYPIENMNSMAAIRLGSNLMRYELLGADAEHIRDMETLGKVISSDEDSIAMETVPKGEKNAIYHFDKREMDRSEIKKMDTKLESVMGRESCYHLISGVATIAAAVARLKKRRLPLEPDPTLSHAGNFLYMMTGEKPTPLEERVMDIALILHADHGMNASTFAAMVVASTLADIYFSVGSGIAALSGPLHGGANEHVLYMLRDIGGSKNVKKWVNKAIKEKKRVMGFGHRVYKAYDPRARVLGPIAEYLAQRTRHVNDENWKMFQTAQSLEKEILDAFGRDKRIFPNVDFYSGIVYSCMGIPADMFTPIFAVSRVSGWTARVMEYLENNRIFRPRAMYVGAFDRKYVQEEDREEVK
ncbi:MAG TPA: citrate/2-methylcitrate synthase [Candidatus Omnitrophota bacterium]|nr:citrate/2-methylcitrate synthase [Candidatus Omnitrophota bacterium]